MISNRDNAKNLDIEREISVFKMNLGTRMRANLNTGACEYCREVAKNPRYSFQSGNGHRLRPRNYSPLRVYVYGLQRV